MLYVQDIAMQNRQGNSLQNHASCCPVVGSKFCLLGLFCMLLGNRHKSMQNEELAIESNGNSAKAVALQTQTGLRRLID